MPRYYIMIRRKNSKRYLGAIPARAGISLPQLRKSAEKQIKPGFAYKIVSESTLKTLLPKLVRRPKMLKKKSASKRVRVSSKKKPLRKRTKKRSMMKKGGRY